MAQKGKPGQHDRQRKEAELVERRKSVSTLRISGAAWGSIAKTCGISVSQARRDWAVWVSELDPPEDKETRRVEIRLQLEELLQRAVLDARDLRSSGKVQDAGTAETRALRLLDRLCKLDGLDLPFNVDITSGGETVSGVSEATLVAAVAALEAMAGDGGG